RATKSFLTRRRNESSDDSCGATTESIEPDEFGRGIRVLYRLQLSADTRPSGREGRLQEGLVEAGHERGHAHGFSGGRQRRRPERNAADGGLVQPRHRYRRELRCCSGHREAFAAANRLALRTSVETLLARQLRGRTPTAHATVQWRGWQGHSRTARHHEKENP